MNNAGTPLFKRILAWIGLLFFLAIFISLIISLFCKADSGVILAHLFCLIVIPCIFYLILWVRKILTRRNQKN